MEVVDRESMEIRIKKVLPFIIPASVHVGVWKFSWGSPALWEVWATAFIPHMSEKIVSSALGGALHPEQD